MAVSTVQLRYDWQDRAAGSRARPADHIVLDRWGIIPRDLAQMPLLGGVLVSRFRLLRQRNSPCR